MPSPADSEEQEHTRYLRVVLGLGIAVLWVLPLRSSFWLDETVTAFVVQSGFGDAMDRAFEFQPMFPTYYVVAWAARAVGGYQEWVLRVPSIVSMGLATLVVARLGRRIFDPETGVLAAIVFATSATGAFLATDARPYALGVLALVVAAWMEIRWLDGGKVGPAIGFVVVAAAVVYIHYLLAAALLAHGVYAIRRRRKVGVRALVAVAAGFLVLLMPLVPWFLDTYERRSVLSLGTGSVALAVAAIAPPAIVAALLIGALLAGRRTRVEPPKLRATHDEAVLLALWVIVPPVALLLASQVSGVGVFTPRYLSSTLPAVALGAAAAIRVVAPMRGRRTIVVTLLAISILVASPLHHTNDAGTVEDWRGALAVAAAAASGDPPVPVLMESPLIEGQRVELLRDPAWTPYLLAPTSVYGAGGAPISAPFGLSPAERAYLEEVVVDRLLPSDGFVLVTSSLDRSLQRWLEGRLEPSGFRSLVLGRHGTVQVVGFERTGEG